MELFAKKISLHKIFNSRHSIILLFCIITVVANSLYVFVYSTYPLISNNNLAKNLGNIRFDIGITLQETLAYFLLVLGLSLYGRSRVIWLITICNLLVIAFVGNFMMSTSYHSNIMIIISLLVLLINFKSFSKQLYLSHGFVFAIAFVVFAVIYGILGSYTLRGEIVGLKTIHDAIYFCMETYSTVGYGDIYPITIRAKYFVISMIVIGLILFTSGATLAIYMLNSKLHNLIFNLNKGKISMSNHVVLIGYGVLAKVLIEKYRLSKTKYIVIDTGTTMDIDHENLKDEDCLLISPYPGNKEALTRARINEAEIIIINFENDSDTIMATMNVSEYLKDMKKRPPIIARIFYEDNISKAKRAGADKIIAPNLIVADEIEALRLNNMMNNLNPNLSKC